MRAHTPTPRHKGTKEREREREREREKERERDRQTDRQTERSKDNDTLTVVSVLPDKFLRQESGALL